MSITLTCLLSLFSAGILAGRVYEILKLTDPETNFLLTGGIILNPYFLVLFAVIALCCGILIFSSYKKIKPFYSKSSKYTAALAGIGMVTAGVMFIKSKPALAVFIAGGLALLIMAFVNFGKSKADYIVMILTLVFSAGLCLEVVSFDVSSFHNTVFLQNTLSSICAIIFMLMVFKNVYIPSKNSRLWLYVFGMLSFAVCSMMNIASIIGFVVTDVSFTPQIVRNIAMALFGIYAFDTAISAIPSLKEIKNEKNNAENANTAADEIAEEKHCYGDSNITAESKILNEKADKELLENQAAVAKLFETFNEKNNEEKSNSKNSELEDDRYQQKCDNQKEIPSISDVFNDFDSQKIFTEKDNKLGETRSFKTITQPKLDETAPEYDMLKSMFKGEGTNSFDIAEQNSNKIEKENIVETENKDEEKDEVSQIILNVKAKADNKDNGRKYFSQEIKTETKKIVYKKPK